MSKIGEEDLVTSCCIGSGLYAHALRENAFAAGHTFSQIFATTLNPATLEKYYEKG